LAGRGTIYDHLVKIDSDHYLNINPNKVTVTGSIGDVEFTKYDFRNYTRLGTRIKESGHWPLEGFDNYFALSQQTGKRHVAS
jgi:hypothetical protein